MDNKERILAYQQAIELEQVELEKVSGGQSHLTASITTKVTNTLPPGLDFAFDQIWD